MPKCTWRERPSDGISCTVTADVGKQLCPRHLFIDELRQQQRDAKLANATALHAAGLKGMLPRNRAALVKEGYHFTGTGQCRGCGQMCDWYNTPRGKHAPFDRMIHDDSLAVSHFATCTRANSFRRSA